MRAATWIGRGWPGLAGLWSRGDLRSLLVALLFAGLLNGALWFTWAAPGNLAGSVRLALWILLGLVWVAGIAGSRRQAGRKPGRRSEEVRALFLQAQTEYLRGHWFEVESLLTRVLQAAPGDVEATLLLATLYRRTQRYDAAREALARIDSLDGGIYWQWEVASERGRLKALDPPAGQTPSPA